MHLLISSPPFSFDLERFEFKCVPMVIHRYSEADRPSARHVKEATSLVATWFREQGKEPFRFQRQAWKAYLSGRNGLIHAQTGTGKTLAAFLGPVIEHLAFGLKSPAIEPSRNSKTRGNGEPARLKVLWITPLRALASDTEANLRAASETLLLNWEVEKRTSDASASQRARQNRSLPEVLVTTPESISLQLTRDDWRERFSGLRLIVIDEWHELLGTKRGIQTELAMSRIRTANPVVRVWGLSATMGNLEQALTSLVFPECVAESILIQGTVPKKTVVQELIPTEMERFPWAGHLGHRMIPQVCDIIRKYSSTLVFTNTRSQAEIWYRELLANMPELAGQMAVHHGSLDQKLRQWIEDRLRDGRLRCCVCTSSLELGVDFPTVDHIVQIGSPKGSARLLQRAGRSGHRPGATSCVTFVPTHALELVEIAAVKQAIAQGHIEQRVPVPAPLDVLAQHVVTCALGGGFKPTELFEEVRRTECYRNLTEEQWQWVIDFAQHGGATLAAYPDYQRIRMVDDVYRVCDRRIAALHRMSIGTIVGDASMQVRFLRGKIIGNVEESFLGRVSPGERFTLGGKLLELVHIRDNTAWVKRGKGQASVVPRWMGGRMPLSSELAHMLRQQLTESLQGIYRGKAMRAVKPLLELQKAWSAVPGYDELLIERWRNRDGHHTFVYPFEGRLVHEGLAALWALRLSRLLPISFTMAMNDYGFLLVSSTEPPLENAFSSGLLSSENVAQTFSTVSTQLRCVKGSFGKSLELPDWSFKGIQGSESSPVTCKLPATCFSMCFLNTTLTICFYSSRDAKFSTSNWNKAD